MEGLRQKRPRLALDLDEYNKLKNLVLNRDGWKCQHCGSLQNLQVHHVVHRSRLGSDESDNLITLCAGCHEKQHRSIRYGDKVSRNQLGCGLPRCIIFRLSIGSILFELYYGRIE